MELIAACSSEDINAVRLLLNKEDIDVNYLNPINDYYTPLGWTCMRGNIEIAKLLLNRENIDTSKNNNGFTPLSSAVVNGNVEIVKLLLSNGVHVDDMSLFRAIMTNDMFLIKLLIDNIGPEINEKIIMLSKLESNLLVCYTEEGNIKIVELLLGNKYIDVNLEDSKGYTAFSRALKNNSYEILKLLIYHGAKPVKNFIDAISDESKYILNNYWKYLPTWTKTTHKLYHEQFKNEVCIVLLISKRYKTIINKNITLMIISELANIWQKI